MKHPKQHLIVDLSTTTFIDSTGVGFLIRLRKIAKENNAKFALANVCPDIQKTFAMMKLCSVFPTGTDIKSAFEKAA